MNITERKPYAPGEILLEEFMQPYALTQVELANRIGVTRRRINEIIKGKRAISPDTAIRLGKFFQISPEYWLNLQMKIDLWNILHKQKKSFDIKPIKLKTE